jgi:glycosyl hydrolase family 114
MPPVHGQFDYQIGGTYTPEPTVQIVDRDRNDEPSPTLYSICYVNAFQTQPTEQPLWTGQHAALLIHDAGQPVEDPSWPGEHILDTSTPVHRDQLLTIIGDWFDGCAKQGFDAVEADNLDSWTRSKGHLTEADNLAFASLLIDRAHRDGLAVGMKNAADMAPEGRRAGFDFAIAEECQVYDECNEYTDVYGDHLIEIEYTDHPRRFFTSACAARGAQSSVILRDRGVVPPTNPDYRYEIC